VSCARVQPAAGDSLGGARNLKLVPSPRPAPPTSCTIHICCIGRPAMPSTSSTPLSRGLPRDQSDPGSVGALHPLWLASLPPHSEGSWLLLSSHAKVRVGTMHGCASFWLQGRAGAGGGGSGGR